MIATIVKIDLVGSKTVSAANQLKNPAIRKQLLEKLIEISRSKFPQSDQKYPAGSYYKAEGDAVYFILDKPTVALRAAIEFMQGWFNVRLPDLDRCPDCRIIIDRGDIQTVATPAGDDFVSAAFENIAVAEKGLQGGSIYASLDVVANCDKTLARFVSYSSVQPRSNEKIEIYRVEFLDPRTTDDSSLLHALFIAHPKSQAARDRILELFILQYLLEKNSLDDFKDFNRWAANRSYPALPLQKLKQLCDESTYLNGTSSGLPGVNGTSYSLTSEGLAILQRAKEEFGRAREDCIQTVQSMIVKQCGTPKATDVYDLAAIIEEYLCAIFSEVRMMANYFRGSSQLFNSETNYLDRFDYILRKHLPFTDGRHFAEWRTAFIEGLKAASGAINGYVAAVFHNVLATYYLNRSTKPSAYQLNKLSERHLYIDTNVLYAMKVGASTYHEAAKYFLDRLAALQITVHMFPFTVEEYEQSLERTEREVKKNEVSAFLLKWNPWLYQEFMRNKPRYLGQIEVCRQQHSIAKGKKVGPQTYDAIDSELQKDSLSLDRDFVRLPPEERDALWAEMRQYMTSSSWAIDEYYDFIQESTKSPEKIAHDTDCIYNLFGKSKAVGRDELGPKLMFVTLDRQLARTAKKYEFVVTSEEFLEFMMPYLFLNDTPVKDAERFPNQLLSAQLGIMLDVVRKVEATDLVRGFLTDPKAADQYAKGQLGSVAREIATTLSASRFEGVVEQARQLDESQMKGVSDQIAAKFEEMDLRQKTSYFDSQAAQFVELKSILAAKDKQIEKLQKTLKYVKRQRSKGDRR
ncbi:MAG TPA: hypothetical protein VGI45_02815 [Terracidiphilus sp.]